LEFRRLKGFLILLLAQEEALHDVLGEVFLCVEGNNLGQYSVDSFVKTTNQCDNCKEVCIGDTSLCGGLFLGDNFLVSEDNPE